MNQRDRHEHALQVFHDAYRLYGEHPTRRQERHINNSLAEWLGDDATSAQITEALATIATLNLRREHRPGLVYHGQDVVPCDDLYQDALGEYEEQDERTLYALIQEIENKAKE